MATQSHLREYIVRGYQERIEGHQALCAAVSSLLDRVIPDKLLVAHSHRLKSVESFYEKSNKTDKKSNSLKYPKPFEQINDVVGFRIIVIAKRHIEDVCNILRGCLEIREEENKADKLLEQGILGYESYHLIAGLGKSRENLKEYEGITNLNFEIQVRTALQHAWAENEHRVQYKSTSKEPELNKRFLRLAGAISSADEEFDRIYEINEILTKNADEISHIISDMEDKDDDVVFTGPANGKNLKGIAKDISDAANMFGVPVSELMREFRYSEAIKVYDRLIVLQPTLHTHYIKRAEAKALSGDMDGAIEDFGIAEGMNPNDKTLAKVFTIIKKLVDEKK